MGAAFSVNGGLVNDLLMRPKNWLTNVIICKIVYTCEDVRYLKRHVCYFLEETSNSLWKHVDVPGCCFVYHSTSIVDDFMGICAYLYKRLACYTITDDLSPQDLSLTQVELTLHYNRLYTKRFRKCREWEQRKHSPRPKDQTWHCPWVLPEIRRNMMGPEVIYHTADKTNWCNDSNPLYKPFRSCLHYSG